MRQRQLPLNRTMGKTQREWLRCVVDHGGWCEASGYLWSTRFTTTGLCEGLAKRGLLRKRRRKFPAPWGWLDFWEPTPAGEREAATIKAKQMRRL